MDGFCKDKKTKDGLSSRCKVCRNAQTAACRKANPEKHRAEVAAYTKANPEKVKANQAAWKKANPEKVKAKMATYRKANPEKVKVRLAFYQKALSDALVKTKIFVCSGIPRDLIPQELIQAKRAHIQINRKLKELKA